MLSNKQRIYPPVSEWIFYKIYLGKNLAEELIIELGKEANNLINQGVAQKWFFIRYSDPNFHVRFRIYCPLNNRMFVLDKINAIISRLLSARIIHNVMIDSYHREFERYGEFAIEHVEDIFCVDSYAILNLIDITMNTCSDIEKFKLQSSIALIEEYFKVFNISLDDKMLILHGISDSMYKEFGFNEYNRKSLNTLYRQYKPLVFSTYENHEDEQITLINNEIKKHHVKYKLSAEKIMNASKGSPLFIQKSLPSYIHMTMNRLWADKNRMYELVIYDFLVRYYKSYIAREKNKRK